MSASRQIDACRGAKLVVTFRPVQRYVEVRGLFTRDHAASSGGVVMVSSPSTATSTATLTLPPSSQPACQANNHRFLLPHESLRSARTGYQWMFCRDCPAKKRVVPIVPIVRRWEGQVGLPVRRWTWRSL